MGKWLLTGMWVTKNQLPESLTPAWMRLSTLAWVEFLTQPSMRLYTIPLPKTPTSHESRAESRMISRVVKEGAPGVSGGGSVALPHLLL